MDKYKDLFFKQKDALREAQSNYQHQLESNKVLRKQVKELEQEIQRLNMVSRMDEDLKNEDLKTIDMYRSALEDVSAILTDDWDGMTPEECRKDVQRYINKVLYEETGKCYRELYKKYHAENKKLKERLQELEKENSYVASWMDKYHEAMVMVQEMESLCKQMGEALEKVKLSMEEIEECKLCDAGKEELGWTIEDAGKALQAYNDVMGEEKEKRNG